MDLLSLTFVPRVNLGKEVDEKLLLRDQIHCWQDISFCTTIISHRSEMRFQQESRSLFFCKYCKFAFRIIVCKYCKKPFQTIFCKLFLWTTLFCVQILHIIIPYYFFLHVIFRILLSSYKVVTKMIMANLIYERILWEITSAIVPKTKVRQSNINLNAFKLNGAKL